LFEAGLKVRREVLGADYVDGSIARADDFMMAFQRITTEMCWGYAWTRPGLNRKTRSLLNLAMLTALNRPAEIKLHVKGALNNGVSVDEIKEVLLHATVYCGIPAGLDAFKAAHAALAEAGALPAATHAVHANGGATAAPADRPARAPSQRRRSPAKN
jgi:4-carboxymuconolactone decarboxylase